jgi:hypothetical protein
LKKNSKSAMKKEQKAKRAKARRPVQREAKEVLAELVEKLQGKLELKSTSASQAEAGPRGELSPNVDRLTVGVDLGDQWNHFCILVLQGETLSEGQLQTREAEVAEFFQALPRCAIPKRLSNVFFFGKLLRVVSPEPRSFLEYPLLADQEVRQRAQCDRQGIRKQVVHSAVAHHHLH